MPAKPPVNEGPKTKCFLCGHLGYADEFVRSDHTGNHYCMPSHEKECRKAYARLKARGTASG